MQSLKNWGPVLVWLTALLLLAACGEDTSLSSTFTPSTTPAATGMPATVPSTAGDLTKAGETPAPVATSTPAVTAAAKTNTAAPAGGLTMKAAYALAEPEIKKWQPDAVYVSIFNPLDSGIGMDEQGRSLQWYFEVVSVGSSRRATWLVKSDPAGKGNVARSIEDQLSKERIQLQEGRKLPPLSSLIDTDQLLKVARDNGGTRSDRPVGFRLARPPKEGEPLAVDLLFYQGENVIRLRIDMESGKPVENVKG